MKGGYDVCGGDWVSCLIGVNFVGWFTSCMCGFDSSFRIIIATILYVRRHSSNLGV